MDELFSALAGVKANPAIEPGLMKICRYLDMSRFHGENQWRNGANALGRRGF